MRDFPQELFMALIFGAVLLAQFLYRQLRQKALLMQAQRVPQAETPAVALLTRTPVQAEPAEAPPAAAQIKARRAAGEIQRDPGRFSRAALMPDRRAVQKAIVIATILRPCHAQRPHEVD